MPRRILYYAIAVIAIFLAGFVPMWLRVRDQSAQREKAEHALTVMRIVKDLGSAAIDARRGEYEAARQEASAFFTAARFEIDERNRSVIAQQQRDALAPLLANRDDLITLLARSDPASADRLANLYVAVRKAFGV
jgi:type II secretory pathway pseudopilin PulG